MKILYMLPSFGGGGAERTVLNLLNQHDPTVFDARVGLLAYEGAFLDQVDADRLEPVPAPRPGERILDWLPRMERIRNAIRIRDHLRRSRPDVLVTLMGTVSMAALVALRLLPAAPQCAWIVREGNNNLPKMTAMGRTYRRFHQFMRGAAYSAADMVLASSRGVAHGLTTNFNVPPELVRTIYNPVDIQALRRQSRNPLPPTLPRRFVLGAGRLVPQKGFDLLVRAFSRIDDPGLDLVIVGEGPERPALEGLVHRTGLSRRVHLPGFVEDPGAYMGAAEVFVLSSRWEGFGHVVAEAMACGCPVVVTDCDFGPREIVEAGYTGLLVPTDDVDAMAAAIREILVDADLRRRLVVRGERRVEDFDVTNIARQYERAFRDVMHRDPPRGVIGKTDAPGE